MHRLYYVKNLLFKSRDKVDAKILEEAVGNHSMIGLNIQQKVLLLQKYYKFMMYRNPVERLVSAYRSKVQRFPLWGFKNNKPLYNWLRINIYRYKFPFLYGQWIEARGMKPIRISFSDFIDYWLDQRLNLDEHFQNIFDLCQPCHVHYNYYGNFKTFDANAKVLIEPLRQGYYQEGELTSDLALQHYKSLSNKQSSTNYSP